MRFTGAKLRFFKTILSVAFGFGLVSAGNAQEPEKLITIESRGAAAKTLFAEMSKQAGRSLLIGQSLAEEPLILRLDRAPLDIVMAKLAFAMDAEWISESGATRLVATKRPPASISARAVDRIRKLQLKALERLKEDSEFSPADANALAEQLAEHFRKLSAKGSQNEFDSEGSKIARKGPFTSLAYRVFAQLDPLDLALVTKTRRIVWSSQPTGMQRALPKSVWSAIAQFQKEEGFWRDAVGTRQFQVDPNRGLPTDLYQLIRKNTDWGGGSNEGQDDPTAPVKVLVIGTSWGTGLNQLAIKLVDAKGKFVSTCDMDTHTLDDNSTRNYEPPKRDPNSLKIELDDLGKEFGKRFQARNESAESKSPMSTELEQYLLHPEKNEPLALIGGQALVKYAVAKKIQLVAVLLDMSMYLNGLDEKGVVDSEMMLTVYRTKGWGYRTEEKDGWLSIGPVIADMEPEFGQMTNRIDRKAIGKLIRGAKKAGYLTFEDAAEYLAATTKDADSEPSFMIWYLVGSFIADTSLITNDDSRKLMLIYGSMDPLQRRAVMEGQTLAFRALTPIQQELIRSIVFGRETWRVRFEPKAQPNQQLDSKIWEWYHNGIGSEPTERYANGVNPQSPVAFKLSQSVMLKRFGNMNGHEYQSEMSAEQYGMQLFYRSRPEYSGSSGDVNYTHVMTMTRRTMNLRLTLDDSTYLSMDAHEVVSQSPKVDSYEKLPADIVQKIEAARKQAEENYARRPKPVPPPILNWW